jgi:hypothetical protein
MRDLNELIDPEAGWELDTALDINERGQIIATGDSPNGEFRAFLLSPIEDGPAPIPLPPGVWPGMGVLVGVVLHRGVTVRRNRRV